MKNIFIICGGTLNYVTPHFALTAPAYGTVGTKIYNELNNIIDKKEYAVEIIPTQMALNAMPDDCLMNYSHFIKHAGLQRLETNYDLSKFVDYLISRPDTRCVIMAAAVCDFEPNHLYNKKTKDSQYIFGKDRKRLSSANSYELHLEPSEKIIDRIRKQRKDIFVVSFKTTAGVGRDETYKKGLLSLKQNSSNLVFANDIKDKINMVITPEEFPYESDNRAEAVKTLAEITYKRLNLTFDDKTIVKNDERAYPEKLLKENAIPQNWVDVMQYLFTHEAFKPLPGTEKTSGHFGCRVTGKDYERITSERKINHNESFQRGMIPVYSFKDGLLVVGGAKPSVGEKTQELIYQQLGDKIDAIIHFHCPLKDVVEGAIVGGSDKYRKGIPQGNLSVIVSSFIKIREQLPFECGSKECALNTVSGMVEVEPRIYAVHLKNHGPNIAFAKNVDPQRIIDFINRYWDLSDKTGGILK